MATRLKLGSGGNPIAPSPAAGWEQVPSLVRGTCSPRFVGGGADATMTVALAASTDALGAQLISPPLKEQTIGGTVKGQALARQTNAGASLRSQLVIRVLSNDGTVVRGTLLDFDPAALSSDWTHNASEENRKFPLAASSPATLTSVDVQHGDRLCIELGGRGTGSIVAQVLLRDSLDDLPEDETTTLTRAAWIEFSADLVWADGPTALARFAAPAVSPSPAPRGGAGAGATASTAASAWGFGAWVDVLPGGWLNDIAIESVTFEPKAVLGGSLDQTYELLVEVGEGAAGSEVTLIQAPDSRRPDTSGGYQFGSAMRFFLPEPVVVKAETRVAVRVADSKANATSVDGIKVSFRELATASRALSSAGATVTDELLKMQDPAHPVADVSAGAWTPSSGVELWPMLDEAVADDGDWVRSPISPAVESAARVRLGPVVDPGVHLAHRVEYRYEKDDALGHRIDLTVRLYRADGTTLIAQRTHSDIDDAVVDGTLILTEAEAATIPSADYATGLVLELAAVKV